MSVSMMLGYAFKSLNQIYFACARRHKYWGVDLSVRESTRNSITAIALISILIALFVMALGSWWDNAYPSGTWRYKLTVTIDTPEGLKTGSAVREIRYSSEPRLLPDMVGSHFRVVGEAAVIDFGNNKYLFALMDADGSYQTFLRVFPYRDKGEKNIIEYYNDMIGQKKELPPLLYPKFATFTDIKNAKTAIGVDYNDFAKIYGQNIKLKNIEIEITNEEVTHIIDSYLPSFGPTYWEWLRTIDYSDPRHSITPNHLKITRPNDSSIKASK